LTAQTFQSDKDFEHDILAIGYGAVYHIGPATGVETSHRLLSNAGLVEKVVGDMGTA